MNTMFTEDNDKVEITKVSDYEDDEDDGAIVIMRTPFKDQNAGQTRSESRTASLKKKQSQRLEEIQEKLTKPSKPRKNPVVEEDSENELNHENEMEDEDDEEIVIERSGRKPSRRISKLEDRKVQQQKKVQETLNNTAEKKPKPKYVSDDESENEGFSEMKESCSVDNPPVTSKKRKLVFDSQISSASGSHANAKKRRGNIQTHDESNESDDEDDLMIVEENEEDVSEAESLDFIDDENLDHENAGSRGGKPDWRKELHKVIDSSAKMTRSTETEVSIFCKVLHIYLTAAAFPGRGYPVFVTDSFNKYPNEKAANLRKCLQVVTDKVDAMLSKFTRSTSWEEEFQEMVDSYSEIRLGFTSKRIVCQACGRRNAITTETIEFQGTLYDTKTYKEISSRSNDERLTMRKLFLIGSHCSNRIEMYHLLRHYLYNLFAICKKKVNEELVLDSRRKRRQSTHIEKDIKEMTNEKNEWVQEQYFMFQKDLERANNQRAGLDWGFEK